MADETANLTFEILKSIQSDLAGLHREMGQLRGEVGGFRDELHAEVGGLRGEMAELRAEMHDEFRDVRSEMSGLRAEMRAGFNDSAARDAALDARISRLDAETTRGFQMVFQELRGHRDFATDTLRDHEQRISRLEEQVLPRK